MIKYSKNEKEERSVFLGNVAYECTVEDLRNAVSFTGPILSVNILTGNNGKAKGCAFLEYGSREAATNACILLTQNIVTLHSRAMRPSLSRELPYNSVTLTHLKSFDEGEIFRKMIEDADVLYEYGEDHAVLLETNKKTDAHFLQFEDGKTVQVSYHELRQVPPGGFTVHINNLHESTTEDSIEELFEQFGRVK